MPERQGDCLQQARCDPDLARVGILRESVVLHRRANSPPKA